MIGIFDSGMGGLNTLFALRKVQPYADIILYRDTKNAPFGNKSRRELIGIVTDGIGHLLNNGADKVLLGCCTASTVYELLPYELKRRTVPIITPVAKKALQVSKNKKIALLATLRTVRSGAFLREAKAIEAGVSLLSIPSGELVTYIEGGASDACVSRELWLLLKGYTKKIEDFGADTLILGCTHFPSLYSTFKCLLPKVNIVSSAKAGALGIEKEKTGRGITRYI